MFKNYFKIAWRNLVKNKVYSAINIVGLAVGMAVAMLIGLWVYDELSYNKSFRNYGQLAQVMQHQTLNGETSSQTSLPYLIGEELRKNYGSDFKSVSMSGWTNDHILAFDEKRITQSGNYFEPQIIQMLSMKMLEGSASALQDSHSIILSKTTAKALFGDADPMNHHIKIDSKFDVKVSGVYEDFPYNSDFKALLFIAPWNLYIDSNVWNEKATNPWRNNSFQAWVQLTDHADFEKVSAKIKDVKLKRVKAEDATFKPVVFLQPMRNWHLYSEFKNGINTGGRIQFVWLFGVIGFFVLLLACINFMNLSTARSEKRAKEVGIRKAVGSLRVQLIGQFLSESLLISLFSFVLALILVQLALPLFNEVADKKTAILWSNPLFWMSGFCFTLITGLLAGSYPALYLSSFKPIKVLKGTFKTDRFAALPRKILVVLQFAVSVILIVGTIIIFQQIEFAKNRPVGYSRNGLIIIPIVTDEIHKHFDAIRNELKNAGVVSEIAESSSATTYVDENDNGFEWKGKSPTVEGNFGVVYVSNDFGKTIDWKIKEGRDFSRNFLTDSSGIILNEASVKFMNLRNPVGETINFNGKLFHVVGVVKDLLMQSPYEPVDRTVFVMSKSTEGVLDVKINPSASLSDAIDKIESVFKKYNPSQPFVYKFVDEEYEKKFGNEQRIGKLSSFFTILAILISCLGLFGLSSFMAEQRTKEIGIRKVLGATVFNLWTLLSKEFISLILISLCISTPIAYYFMHNWLQHYEYRTNISFWIFFITAIGVISITLATVSFQAIKAALANPVKSLRSE